CAAVLLAGCAAKEPPKLLAVGDSPWYPLRVGCTWIYKGPGHEMKRQVMKHEAVGQQTCAVIETFLDGKPRFKEHVYATDDGVYLKSVEGGLLSVALPLLKLPP